MQPSSGRRFWQIVALAALSGLVSVSPAGAAVMSVGEFVALKSQWPRMAEVNTTFTVEGRYSSLSPTLLRFRHCELGFRPQAGQVFPKLPKASRTVEVSGRLTLDRGKPVFLVDSVRELPDDQQRVRLEQLKLNPDDAAAWYRLGQWIRDRSSFYDDQELAKSAATIFRRGVTIEQRRARTADELRALAKRINNLQLDEALQQELLHEAIWMDRRTGKSLIALKGQVRQQLKNAETPVQNPLPASAYLRDPITEYRNANAEQRLGLHRILYVDLERELIEKDAAADGSNGFEIARRLEDVSSELSDRADEFRDRELVFRSRNLQTATRAEMMELAELYRNRDRLKTAERTLRDWIRLQEPRWRRQGTPGLVRLADEYLDLLDDDQQAIELLKEAHLTSQGDPEILSRLAALGVTLRNEQWVEVAGAEALREARRAAGAGGRLRPGMSRQDVLTAMGQPDSISRIVSSRAVTELWIYRSGATSGVSVQLRRLPSNPGSGNVVSVNPITAN